MIEEDKGYTAAQRNGLENFLDATLPNEKPGANPVFDKILADADAQEKRISDDIQRIEAHIKGKLDAKGIDTSDGLSAGIQRYVGMPVGESEGEVDPEELCEQVHEYQTAVQDFKEQVLKEVPGLSSIAVDSVFDRLSGANPEEDLCHGVTTGQLQDRETFRG